MMRSGADLYSRFRWLPHVTAFLVLGFLALPLLVVVPVAFSDSSLLKFPPDGYSLRWFEAFLADRRWTGAFLTSVHIGVIVSALSTLIGLTTSIVLTRASFFGISMLRALVIGPLMVPVIVIAISLYYIFIRLGMNGTMLAVILGHIVVTLPYSVVVLSAALTETDIRIEKAAVGLGAHPARAFVLTTLPLIAPAVAVSLLFSFLVSFDEVIISQFLTGPRTMTLPRQLWDSIQSDFNPTVAAVSVLLIAMSVIIMLCSELLRRHLTRRRSKKEA